MTDETRTEQQRKWMASVRASLQASTGRSLDDWVQIARTCPETAPKARQRWFKEVHGLGQNYAMVILGEAAARTGENPRDPGVLRAALWTAPEAVAILAALEKAVAAAPDLVTGQRKGYTSWSRAYAFAAARPMRDGTVRLGLAVDPGVDPGLQAANREGWSERLKSTLVLSSPGAVDAAVAALLQVAWQAS